MPTDAFTKKSMPPSRTSIPNSSADGSGPTPIRLAGSEQVWTSAGWYEKFGLPFDSRATGYGQSSDEVGAVQGIEGAQLTGYFDAVHERTLAMPACG